MSMKKRILHLALSIVSIVTMRCSDDGKPTMIPVVATNDASSITPSSVVLNGKITDDGNSPITVTGFVYSSTVSIPTLADEKVALGDINIDFSTVLEGLKSGTTYHLRAYATNSVGTGYGDVINVTTSNAAPTVKDISITGGLEVNKTITATYSYSDAEGDAESGSKFQWYVANDGTGAGETTIAEATTLEYTIKEAQQGKYLRIGITPKASTGNMSGAEVKSAFIGGIGEATTVTFTYNNREVTYGIISSSTTGRKWLDRNLGAPNIASAIDDYANYGDLFQWGRFDDGHQVVNRVGKTDADVTSPNGTTSANLPYGYSSSDIPGNSLFIIIPNGALPGDWRKPQNNNLWQGVDGANNPCPKGWRIATKSEWDEENLQNIGDAYNKFKLTYTGFHYINSSFYGSEYGYYWTSSSSASEPTQAQAIFLGETGSTIDLVRGSGSACRCIKN